MRTAEAEREDAAADADPLNFRETDDGKMHWFFHLIMLVGAVYASMLLTNWGELSVITNNGGCCRRINQFVNLGISVTQPHYLASPH